MVADGKDKKETMGKILSLTKYFLLNNKKSAIENILKSSNMDQYWALYRLYEKRHAPKKIKINQQAIEKRNKVGREKLVDDYKKLQYKSADCLFIRENNELFSNKQDKTGIITMPVGENMQWAGR